MYEVHEIIGFILFGAIGLYFAAFWLSTLFAWVYNCYVHEGEKDFLDLACYIDSNTDNDSPVSLRVFTGLVCPFLAIFIARLIYVVAEHTGMLIPYLFLGLILTWLSLYILRAVVRLNKKLDKHAKDKDAHK